MVMASKKDLELFRSSYEMYERTKKETERKMKDSYNEDGTKKYTKEQIDEQIELIAEAQRDIVEQYKQIGGNPEDLIKGRKRKINKVQDEDLGVENQIQHEKESVKPLTPTNIIEDTLPDKGEYNAQAAFDVIRLPSKGEGYKSKKSTMPVAYLTAYDENMIVSPNLYRDNHIIDYLLKEKVLNDEIDTMDLLEGDRDAIVLFLRANGYGNEYPITVTDDRTGIDFDTVIDLSKLSYKDFNLKGDTNGWFEYKLPVSGKIVKFRFPTHRDNVMLKKLEESDDKKSRKAIINGYAEILSDYLDKEEDMTKERKVKVRQAVNEIAKWGDSIDDNEEYVSHSITNRLNLLIMSVDDVTDRNYISNFIKNMPVKDSASLRKYIAKNEPGVDFNITVERPESLGGGSMKVFLQLDQYVFLNITD